MITIKVTRNEFLPDRTLGHLEVYKDKKLVYECDTLEDTLRGDGDPKTVSQWKVPGETCIPYGIYRAKTEMHKKFGHCARLFNVPGYEGILVHSGNTPEDTRGCVLVGVLNRVTKQIVNSKQTLEQFYNVVGYDEFSVEVTK